VSQSTIKLKCPNLPCRTVLAVPASARGKKVKCRACGTTIRVPTGRSTATASEAAQPAQEG